MHHAPEYRTCQGTPSGSSASSVSSSKSWAGPGLGARLLLTSRSRTRSSSGRHVAELSGAVVMEIEAHDGSIPDAKTRASVHKEVAKLHHENLLIFVDRGIRAFGTGSSGKTASRSLATTST